MAKAEPQSTETNGKTKRSKAAADGKQPAGEKVGGEAAEKGAPRPRKHNYGIVGEHTVQIVPRDKEAGEVKLKAGEAEGYAMAVKGCTVEAFLAESDRGILRRLSRKGLVNVKGTDGTLYPITYVAPEPKPKADKADKKEAGETKAA